MKAGNKILNNKELDKRATLSISDFHSPPQGYIVKYLWFEASPYMGRGYRKGHAEGGHNTTANKASWETYTGSA